MVSGRNNTPTIDELITLHKFRWLATKPAKLRKNGYANALCYKNESGYTEYKITNLNGFRQTVAGGLCRRVLEVNEAVHFASQLQFATGSITGPVISRLHIWLTDSLPRSFTEQRDIGASIKLQPNWDVVDTNRHELPSASKINFECCRHRVGPRFVGCTVVCGWLQSLRSTQIFFVAATTAPGTFVTPEPAITSKMPLTAMPATRGRLTLSSIGLLVGFPGHALRSRGSLGRMKFVNRSCSGVPSFRSNSLTFHPSSNLEKSVLNMSSYRLNQESKVVHVKTNTKGAQRSINAQNEIRNSCTALRIYSVSGYNFLEFLTRSGAPLATGIWPILGHDWLSRLDAGPARVPNFGPTSSGPGFSAVAAPKACGILRMPVNRLPRRAVFAQPCEGWKRARDG
ncbi:hypothetical protein T265_03010 [Opisthorchis viverrini]|uniref:Uncharacterized protein n=1 Tax=Opisthorchis viverrini TaxID=6198 RepID=A0A075AHV1_OPIVI|nr:hypothetical protein T265_03010 [Opisthorchis viverrini]KER30524.1 hypothetical protein T265_03010 [Opisthorchis viverrini]